MRVLGIDPGLRLTGYGCLDGVGDAARLVEAGVLRLGAGGGRTAPAIADRLAELDADLSELLERLRPDLVAVEVVFVHTEHPATAIVMAHARGVILLNIRRRGCVLVELRPNDVKRFVTGNGHAAKTQVQENVRARLRLADRPEPPDVADALAIALCAAWRAASPLPGGKGLGEGFMHHNQTHTAAQRP